METYDPFHPHRRANAHDPTAMPSGAQPPSDDVAAMFQDGSGGRSITGQAGPVGTGLSSSDQKLDRIIELLETMPELIANAIREGATGS